MLIVNFHQCLRYEWWYSRFFCYQFLGIRSQFGEKTWFLVSLQIVLNLQTHEFGSQNIIHMAVTKIAWRDEEEDKSWVDMKLFSENVLEILIFFLDSKYLVCSNFSSFKFIKCPSLMKYWWEPFVYHHQFLTFWLSYRTLVRIWNCGC